MVVCPAGGSQPLRTPLHLCDRCGGGDRGSPRKSASCGSEAAVCSPTTLTGLVTSWQTQDAWVVERKRENAPFSLLLSLLCSRKVFKADVKDLAHSDSSCIQNRSPAQPLGGHHALCSLAGPETPISYTLGPEEKAGGGWALAAAPGG